MDIEQIEKIAIQKRNEAKSQLHALFKIPEGFGYKLIDDFVDSIIVCCMLEITAMQAASMKGSKESATNTNETK